MSINNRDIAVKSYFRESLFSRMEATRAETGESRSQYLQNAVLASLHRADHSPRPARRASTKVGLSFPGRRGGAPIPIRY